MKRDSVVWGILLILLGVGFLVYRWNPGLFAGFSWPWLFLGIGVIFTVASLLTRTGGLLIPGLILLALGGIFTYQTNSGNWSSWAYIWPLMPGMAGAGMFISSFYDREMAPARGPGLVMAAISLIVFAILGGFFGLDPGLLRYWPVLLILVGAVVFFRALRPQK